MKLDVVGRVKASDAVNANELATKGQLDAAAFSTITHKALTDAYVPILTDGGNVVLKYNGATDLVSSSIPDDATLDFDDGTSLIYVTTGAGKALADFPTSSGRKYIETVLDANKDEKFVLIKESDDNWYALGDYNYIAAPVLTPPAFVSANTAENNYKQR